MAESDNKDWKETSEPRIHNGEEKMNENTRVRIPSFEGHTIDQLVWVVSYGKYNRKYRVFTHRREAAEFAATMDKQESRLIEAVMEKDLS